VSNNERIVGRVKVSIERDGRATTNLGFLLVENEPPERLALLFRGLARSATRVVLDV
jgi:hypothetical protein